MSHCRIGERLLHPGVETQDVIRAYVLTIKSLKVVDDSGVLLHSIAQPIRSYLK
jgi:anaphase-promoting complex subunit 2